jgi:hypothetical protein
MRIILRLLVLVTTLTFSGAAFAKCGPAFEGIWRNDIGPISGQYARMDFTSQSGKVSLMTETSTDAQHKSNIYLALYSEPKNIIAEETGNNTCAIKFAGRPDIAIDPYNAYRDYAQTARLTVDGSAIQWCWSRAGHHGGDCVTFRHVATIEQALSGDFD